MKFNPIFWKKSHHGLLWSQWDPADTKDCLSDTTNVISKRIGWSSEKYRGISLTQHFHQGELLNYVICIREMENSTSVFNFNNIQGSGSIGRIFTEELAGVNSAETRRDGVIELFFCAYVVVKGSVTIPNQNRFFYVTLLYS